MRSGSGMGVNAAEVIKGISPIAQPQNPINIIEAYLSLVNFISYELIAAVLWEIEKYKIGVSYEELIEEASKIYEVEFTSKDSKIYRWTDISKNIEKIFKPFNIVSLQT